MKKPEKKRESPIGPPMCKICETRHWSNQSHNFKPTKKKRANRDRDD